MSASKLVVNCEAQALARMLDEADDWDAKDRPDQAAKVRHAVKAAMIAGGIVDPHTESVRRIKLTATEIKQRARDEKEHAARVSAEDRAVADRTALVARLQSGKATPTEVQQALAQLLT